MFSVTNSIWPSALTTNKNPSNTYKKKFNNGKQKISKTLHVLHTESNNGANCVFDNLVGFEDDTSPCWTAASVLIKQFFVCSDEILRACKQNIKLGLNILVFSYIKNTN